MTSQIDPEFEPSAFKKDVHQDETRALDHFDRGLGMNFDAGFGSLLDDTGAADIARTLRDHRVSDE